jgi:hypothetical protein
MAPAKPITTCEFTSMLRRCKPPTGWPRKLGTGDGSSIHNVTDDYPLLAIANSGGPDSTCLSFLLNDALRELRTARCDSNGTVVRGLGFSERGPPISILFFRDVPQNFSNLSLPRHPSRNPTDPVGLPSIHEPSHPRTNPLSVSHETRDTRFYSLACASTKRM